MKVILEDANPPQANCAPYLKQSGSDYPTVDVSQIISITAGYYKKDKQVLLKLSNTIQGTDGTYDIPVGGDVPLTDTLKNQTQSFEVSNIYDSSNITYILTYGKESDFKTFFSSQYAVGNITNISILTSQILENGEYSCPAPKFQIKSITSTSANVKILSNSGDYDRYLIKYKEVDSNVDVIVESSVDETTIPNLNTNTIYDVFVCGYCSYPKDYSFYSEPQKVKTL